MPPRPEARRRSRDGGAVGEVVTVVGASGGCGASTLAALLAHRRATRGRTVLVDLDPGAAGLEVLLGVEAVPGVRWADLGHAAGGLGPEDLTGVLPTWAGVEVLSEDRRPGGGTPEARAAVLDALVAGASTVVLDASARAIAALPDVARLLGAAPGVLVTRQDVGGMAAGLRARSAVGPTRGLVLRRWSGSSVAPVEAAHLLGTRLLGRIDEDTGLRDAVERGLGPRPARRLGRLVASVDAALSQERHP